MGARGRNVVDGWANVSEKSRGNLGRILYVWESEHDCERLESQGVTSSDTPELWV